MFTALLDTSVLWPSLQRDFLLSLAIEGMYRPVWSDAILDELEGTEHAKLISRGADDTTASKRSHRLVETMRTAFDDALVEGWEALEGSFGLPDPDDEHVLAAAVIAGAGAIVTSNLRHFPAALLPGTIEPLSPAEFALNTVALSPTSARRAVSQIASRSGRHGPELSERDVLTVLADRYAMHEAVELVRSVL